jgi:hypothetical protein
MRALPRYSRPNNSRPCQLRGLGPVTWDYFLMLLGTPGVKADTWIVRFAADALGRHV